MDSFVHQNSVPSVQMHRRITAILRAMATLAFFEPMRRARRVPQALSGDQRWTFVNNTPAASKRQVRVKRDRQTSIFFLAGPFLRTDIDAASIRDTDLRRARLNRSGSSMVERNAKAVMGPTLGTVVKRCKVGSARTKQRISLSRAATLATATCRTSISLSIGADNTG